MGVFFNNEQDGYVNEGVSKIFNKIINKRNLKKCRDIKKKILG